jgi:hypothetical protein
LTARDPGSLFRYTLRLVERARHKVSTDHHAAGPAFCVGVARFAGEQLDRRDLPNSEIAMGVARRDARMAALPATCGEGDCPLGFTGRSNGPLGTVQKNDQPRWP